MRWTLTLCVPLVSAAILGGCTQDVDPNPDQNKTPIDHATNQPRQNLQVSLTGCLGTGPGTGQFVLTQVQPAPLGSQPSDAMSSANVDFAKTPAVRLTANAEQDLTSLVGRTVSVLGVLRDVGKNTIGTTEASRQPASGDAREPQTADVGRYPEMMLQEVTPTGERCQPDQRREPR